MARRCDAPWRNDKQSTQKGSSSDRVSRDCLYCGAIRIDSQIGLEPSLGEYVDTMVAVFREVKRVLRKDGVCWINMGDCYASSVNGRPAAEIVNDDRTFRDKPFSTIGVISRVGASGNKGNSGADHGFRVQPEGYLKPKDLCGIPWRLAFALQADGWWLRQDIIWSKPNPMPESVTDRCTKSHEYLFLLTKAANYYYDAEAIKEPQSDGTHERFGEDGQRSTNTPKATSPGQGIKNNRSMDAALKNMVLPNGRNKRSVWEIATAPFSEAHFATFPPALIEPCIKAGTSEKGCCAKCGKPWVRQIEYGDLVPTRHYPNKRAYGVVIDNPDPRDLGRARARTGHRAGMAYEAKTLGWSPSCACNAEVVPCTVLDPFAGAGTTGLVADRLGRNAVLIELNPTYAAMAERRLRDDAGMFANVGDYDGNADFAKSYETCLAAVRERVVAGGPSWEPAEPPVTDDGPLFAWAREAAE